MKKITGYILSAVGIIGLIVTYAPVNKALGTVIPLSLIMTATIISLVLLVIGIFFIVKADAPKIHEVPIYHGKDVVGFRRIQKK